MLEEMLEHLARRARTSAVRVLVLSSTDHMGLSAGADVREELDADGRVHRMELFAKPLRRPHGLPEADGRRLPRLLRRRRRRDRRRLRPARRRLEPAPALPRRRARRPGGAGAAGHAVRPVGRQVPAADGQGGERRHGAPLGAGAQGGARPPAPRRRRCSSRRPSPRTRPRRSRRSSACSTSGTASRAARGSRARARWSGSAPAPASRFGSRDLRTRPRLQFVP